MNKKLLALAVAAALAPAAAMADSGNVVISGKIAADVTFLNGTGKTTVADNNTHQVNNNNSVLTLSGNEDLGNGNKAFFSLTYGLNMISAASALSGQNQIIGLEGKTWGKVFAGAFDNPLKVMGRATDLFADQSTGDARTLTAKGSVEARANDVIAYITPSFNGFQGVLAHSNNPLTTVAVDNNNATTSGATTSATTAMNIVKLTYANGPLSLAYGHHNISLTPAFAHDETANRVTGAYTMGDVKFVGSWQKVKNATSGIIAGASAAGVGTDQLNAASAAQADYKVWGLGAAYKMGATTLKGQYYKLTHEGVNGVAVANADANMVAIGADYAMSKRTTLQLAYSKVNNDSSATYGGNSGVAGADVYGVVGGNDPSRVSLGMKHTF